MEEQRQLLPNHAQEIFRGDEHSGTRNNYGEMKRSEQCSLHSARHTQRLSFYVLQSIGLKSGRTLGRVSTSKTQNDKKQKRHDKETYHNITTARIEFEDIYNHSVVGGSSVYIICAFDFITSKTNYRISRDDANTILRKYTGGRWRVVLGRFLMANGEFFVCTKTSGIPAATVGSFFRSGPLTAFFSHTHPQGAILSQFEYRYKKRK